MSTESTVEKHAFQAEVRQLLDIVIHSLYTDREIFIRELVSNASDALEKLRHIQLSEQSLFDDNLPLEINVNTDEAAGTLTIQDFGVGMSREELNENLGTIAHSGSRAFLQALKEAGGAGTETGRNLIGQFGVGFYSAFMAAKEVRVYTRTWKPEGEHLLWTSEGGGEYAIEAVEGQRRGTKVVVLLSEDHKEFAKESRVREVLRRYSNFVQYPINLNGERVNTVQAIWMRNKGEVSEEEYTGFYKFSADAFDEPRYHLHFNTDAPLEIHALLFVPQSNPERLGLMRMEPGVALYCRKVMIDPKPEGLLPEWMRFVRGVIDSADLPLNISRESMQDSQLVQKLGRVMCKRFIRFLDGEATKNPEGYAAFFDEFGNFLKEGCATDPSHREDLARLLRFETSREEAGTRAGLADYVGRMTEGQEAIYYLHGESREALEAGPYLEGFKARGIEVLLLTDTHDLFVMEHLGTFDEKKLVPAESADIDLPEPSETPGGEPLEESELTELARFIRDALGDRTGEVAASKRLVSSPAAVVTDDKMISPTMRRMMKAMNREAPPIPRVRFEINPRHPLIHGLNRLRTADPERARLVGIQLFDNALLAAGLIDDPSRLAGDMNRVLEKLLTSPGG